MEFFAIDDHRGDLLVHENQCRGDQGRNDRQGNGPGRVLAEERNQPATILGARRKEFPGNMQLGSVQAEIGIPAGHQDNGDEHGEITQKRSDLETPFALRSSLALQATYLTGEERTSTKLLQGHADEKRQDEQKDRIEENVGVVDRSGTAGADEQATRLDTSELQTLIQRVSVNRLVVDVHSLPSELEE